MTVIEASERWESERVGRQRPGGYRVRGHTVHFVLMEAYLKPAKWDKGRNERRVKLAIVELSGMGYPTKIDIRQKAVRRILVVRTVCLKGRGHDVYKRYMREMTELIDRAEKLYPNWFLIKGMPDWGKAFADKPAIQVPDSAA